MTPRESSLLLAAAQLLSANRDTAYGPAHAVRDALALETEVSQQLSPRIGAAVTGEDYRAPVSDLTTAFRTAGAL